MVAGNVSDQLKKEDIMSIELDDDGGIVSHMKMGGSNDDYCTSMVLSASDGEQSDFALVGATNSHTSGCTGSRGLQIGETPLCSC